MDHSKEKTPFLKSLTGKGLYFALAVCIVAVGGLVTAGLTGDLNDPAPLDTATTTVADRAVEQKATNIPDTRPTTTTTRTTTTTAAPAQTAPSVDAPLMVLPMGNQLVKEFSNGKAVYSDTMADFRTHNGADFVGKAGDKVAAVSAGEVTAVKEDALWGKMLTIDHGYGITSTYCGVTASVKVGDTVKAGDTIGALSDIPCELLTGHHLHLEIAVNGETVDPVEAIGLEVARVTAVSATTTTTTTTTTAGKTTTTTKK